MYLQDHLMLISSEEPKEEEVGISQVSPVVEEVTEEEDIYLDTDEVDVEEAVEAALVAVSVVVESVEEEVITIVTTTIEGRITIMELIYWILRGTLKLKKSQLLFKLMYGTIYVLNKGQSKGGSIIIMVI